MAALASLTEAYTDSEGEEHMSQSDAQDEDDDAPMPRPKPQPKEKVPERQFTPVPAPPPPIPIPPMRALSPVVPIQQVSTTTEPPSGVTVSATSKLVSYLNDTVISDDESERDSPPKSTDMSQSASVELPPEPLGKCSAELQQKISLLTDKMKLKGDDMNEVIQKRKSFRNPSIYEKLIQFCDINEFGTNYQPHIYDPLKWNKNSYYDELAKVQKADMDRRERERKEKTKVEFLIGTAKKPAANGPAVPLATVNAGDDDSKKRKSKWDQVGLMTTGGQIRAPTGLLPTLTSSTTGTKGTVISAFGSLPKKLKN